MTDKADSGMGVQCAVLTSSGYEAMALTSLPAEGAQYLASCLQETCDLHNQELLSC